jgi:ATP-dependent Clp endopeptidase proteolytic subunit ClpP
MVSLAGKKKSKNDKSEASDEDNLTVSIEGIENTAAENKPRFLCLYGDINEENAHDMISSILYLHKVGRNIVSYSTNEGKDVETVEIIEPIELYISTTGGTAHDMFAIYDVIKNVQDNGTTLETVGLGKVMSAGVLILASGTKGKRKIGKNCRIMIHGVVTGQHGQLHDIENEMEEARWTQERYIDALCENSNMTKKYIKKLIDRKVNVYVDAKEAVELGLADEII